MSDARQEQHDPDQQLAALSEALDDLGRHERRAAPAGLEDRIFMRTRPTATTSGVLARIGGVARTGWRMAAMVALCAVATVALYLGVRSGAGTSGAGDGVSIDMVALDHDFDAWLTAMDESADDDISEVASVMKRVEAAYDDFWSDDLAVGEESL
ncbi:MAG: hypothetical protein KDA21_01285 [Phycisphaerales bacterium]|nr:hypothetical protein [Phycisphaerales bacterium]